MSAWQTKAIPWRDYIPVSVRPSTSFRTMPPRFGPD
jgi:hypothetical protein